MKKLNLLKILLVVMLISCSKSKEKGTGQIPDQIEVLEYKTNIPLASVQIDLYHCSNYDAVFGCLAKQIFSTEFTDNTGKYTFKSGELNRADEGIVLHKATYWDTNGGSGTIFMSPEAWIDLHLTRQNNYPDTSLFRFIVTGEYGRVNLITFQSPADTVVKVRAFGNETNTIDWQVIVKDRACYQYCIIDTLAKGVLTQHLDKFGTASLSISY